MTQETHDSLVAQGLDLCAAHGDYVTQDQIRTLSGFPICASCCRTNTHKRRRNK
jgi:hypothetical protein